MCLVTSTVQILIGIRIRNVDRDMAMGNVHLRTGKDKFPCGECSPQNREGQVSVWNIIKGTSCKEQTGLVRHFFYFQCTILRFMHWCIVMYNIQYVV